MNQAFVNFFCVFIVYVQQKLILWIKEQNLFKEL